MGESCLGIRTRPLRRLVWVLALAACVQPNVNDPHQETDGAQDQMTWCSRYISCMEQTGMAGTASVKATYGPEGSCYDIAGATAQDCYNDCRTLLLQIAILQPEIETCRECDDSWPCQSGNVCNGGLCDPI